MECNQTTLYVAGGMFGTGESREFRLVQASGENSLPYVRKGSTSANALYRLISQHADLFELSSDLSKVTLVRAGVAHSYPGNSSVIALTSEQISMVKMSLKQQNLKHNNCL